MQCHGPENPRMGKIGTHIILNVIIHPIEHIEVKQTFCESLFLRAMSLKIYIGVN